MEEIWKDIKGYEGLYQVSNTGKVKSLERKVKHWQGGYLTKKEIVLKSSISKGYLVISLYKNGIQIRKYIHRLVAEAFIPNPDNLPQINHIDENKMNNCVENLEWCTAEFNVNYGTRNKRVAICMTNNVRSKPVIQYDLNGNFIMEYPSTREVERQTGYNQSNIVKCCLGEKSYYTQYGYIWRYK